MVIENKSFRILKRILFFALCIASLSYLYFFHENLLNHEVEHVSGFTRIIVPDTIVYAALVDLNEPLFSLISSGVKNSIGPGLIWLFSNKNWYIVLVINLVTIGLITDYFEKIANFYCLHEFTKQIGVIIILTSPFSLYYSIGALKELPVMLFLLMGTYGYLYKKWKLMLVASFFLVLFRYQMFVVLGLMFCVVYFNRDIFKNAVYILIIAASMYPGISSLGILSSGATDYYRDLYGVQGSLGSVVETVRSNVYVLSFFAIIFRVFQTLFEPLILIANRMSFYEDGSLSVFDVMQFTTSCFYVFFVWRLYLNMKKVLKFGRNISIEEQFIFAFLLISLILTCGFSFIHHRYSLPFFPLMYIASMMHLSKKSNTVPL